MTCNRSATRCKAVYSDEAGDCITRGFFILVHCEVTQQIELCTAPSPHKGAPCTASPHSPKGHIQLLEKICVWARKGANYHSNLSRKAEWSLLTNGDIGYFPGIHRVLRADSIVPVHELPAARLKCRENEVSAHTHATHVAHESNTKLFSFQSNRCRRP